MTAPDNPVAWGNALTAMPVDHAFAADLADAVANDGDRDTAARWWLTLAVDFLRGRGQPHGAWAAFDFAIYDWEALARTWAVVHRSIEDYGADPCVGPMLARFVSERLPSVWGEPAFVPHPPATRALVIADRIDTLVGMFWAGMKPNGSKDPYALRRAARHLLMQIVCPFTVGRRVAA